MLVRCWRGCLRCRAGCWGCWCCRRRLCWFRVFPLVRVLWRSVRVLVAVQVWVLQLLVLSLGVVGWVLLGVGMETSARIGEVPPPPSEYHHPPGHHLQPPTPPTCTHSSPGGALTNTITSTTYSGNTATPPPTHSIDSLDHNRCNTCHYRPKDSRRK